MNHLTEFGAPRHSKGVQARRLTALVAILALLSSGLRAEQALLSPPVATIQGLCDALIGAMKMGTSVGFDARKSALEPVIRRSLDLPLMSRLVMGPPWRTLSPELQSQLVKAFSDYSVATYTNRFSSFSNERFTVDTATTTMGNGDVIVHSRLFTNDPDPVRLDYLMREKSGQWQVIDVFLNGTISELAARRSEYSALLRSGGPQALIDMLEKKAADLSR